MRRGRSRKREEKKARHSAAASAKPVVSRISGLAHEPCAATPAPAAEENALRAHSLSVLLGDVTPLGGTERVTREREHNARGANETLGETALARPPSFVVERDGQQFSGWRRALPWPRVKPGHGRNWLPDVRLDLHGVRVRDVSARLALAIGECVKHRRTRLLIIHGKGLHSASGEGALAEAVLESLTLGRYAARVRRFSTAAERLGGSGAFAVELDV